MALKTKVTNKGSRTFDKELNGTRYNIKPGETIVMNRRSAVGLRGLYTPRGETVSLELEHLPGEDNKHACHFCGIEFPTKDVLKKHLKTHSSDVLEDTETEKVFVSPDGGEFKSKAALMSHLRAAARKQKDDTSSNTGDDTKSGL